MQRSFLLFSNAIPAKTIDKYIDAFCGRIPKSVLQKHYTDYSPYALKRECDKVESVLTLNLDDDYH